MNKILKVGFLIRENSTNNNIKNIINRCFSEKNIKVFIINTKENNSNFSINNFIIKFLIFVEYFKIKNFKKNFIINHINSDKIKELKLDLIVSLQNENLEKFFNLSKYGIIKIDSSYLYANCDKILSGFWEVYKEDSFTHFSIKYLNKENNLFLLREGSFPTKNFFLLNQNLFYEKSFYYLKLVIWDILKKNSKYSIIKKHNNIRLAIKKIGSKILLNYFINLGKRFLKKILTFKILNKKLIWSVYYGKLYWKKINIKKKINKIQNVKNTYLADPFIVNFNKKNIYLLKNIILTKKKGSLFYIIS